MSDQSQGPGWWVASDGKWYPPESAAPAPAPAPAAPAPAAPAFPAASGVPPVATPPPKKRRTGLIIGIVVAVVVVAGAVVLLASGSGDDAGGEEQSFDDVEALVEALNDQGVACEDFEEVEASAGVLNLNEASSSGTCTVDGTVLVADVYENDGDGEENIDRLAELSRDCEFAPDADGESDFASGGNWLIGIQGEFTEGDHGDLVDEVAAVLGGEAVELGCQD